MASDTPLSAADTLRQRPFSTLADNELAYAHARLAHDMARGFTVHTSYGDIVVPAGHVADLMGALVRQELSLEEKRRGVTV